MSLEDLNYWVGSLKEKLSEPEKIIANPIIEDLKERIQHLVDVGVGYTSLDRSTPSLSGGEAQRLRLASLLGSGLTGVLYVLDEPTIGLHPRDTLKMIKFMQRLRDLGNTVLVIEHDSEVLNAADYLFDIGPGAGKNGGDVIACGSPQEIKNSKKSITGQYLSGRQKMPVSDEIQDSIHHWLTISGAKQNNLKNLTVSIPLGQFVVVTGVSGSGKSSLIFDILDRAARNHFYSTNEEQGVYQSITGFSHLNKVVTIDQKAIGRIPRSNAATYTDTFQGIREVFAKTPKAVEMKY
jgi:excinuclease ABC subunit A